MEHTQEQKKIFDFIKNSNKNGIIDAVAGSGKTTTIVDSIDFIPNVQEKRILFCAFNKSIEQEISARFKKKGHTSIIVKTIHSLGYDILKNNSSKRYNFNNFRYDHIIKNYIDKNDKSFLGCIGKIRDVIPSISSEVKAFRFNLQKELTDMLNKFRLTLTSFKDFDNFIKHFRLLADLREKMSISDFEDALDIYHNAIFDILEEGNHIAENQKIIDFTDMLYLPQELELFPIKLYDIIFVDECQDLSKAQLNIVRKYLKENGRLISVGDPAQSIYGFAGADVESFNRVKEIPNTKSLKLSTCFRCPENVILKARKYRLDLSPFTKKEGFIEEDVALEDALKKVESENLVISRTKEPMLLFLFYLIDKGKKVNVREDDLKEVINSIKLIFTKEELEKSDIDFDTKQKILERNEYIIQQRAKKIKSDYQEDYLRIELKLLQAKINFVKIQLQNNNVKNISELLNKIKKLFSDKNKGIRLATIHRAKGLESESVFILDYSSLPLKGDNMAEWKKIQEENLVYVALTRTKKYLYLGKWNIRGMNEEEWVDRAVDRFKNQYGNIYDESISNSRFAKQLKEE